MSSLAYVSLPEVFVWPSRKLQFISFPVGHFSRAFISQQISMVGIAWLTVEMVLSTPAICLEFRVLVKISASFFAKKHVFNLFY